MASSTTIKGGEKAIAYINDLLAKIGSGAAVKVGFLAGATYPNGTPVAYIAAIQNFGAPRAGIPARPFFSSMVADKSPEWGPLTAQALKARSFDGAKALDLVGEHIEGELRQSIRDTTEPPLKPATIARKGFSQPLIDTSHMINSVGRKVVA